MINTNYRKYCDKYSSILFYNTPLENVLLEEIFHWRGLFLFSMASGM